MEDKQIIGLMVEFKRNLEDNCLKYIDNVHISTVIGVNEDLLAKLINKVIKDEK